MVKSRLAASARGAGDNASAVTGRFVHVTLPGNAILSLAEVQVFSGDRNAAKDKPAVQTTTSHSAPASRAVDGNTSGAWEKGSITHTHENDKDPAWEVDLGSNTPIGAVSLWNRDGLEGRLNNARVFILDENRNQVWSTTVAKAAQGENRLTTDAGTRPGPGGGLA